ncbi:MAG: diaminopimelate epimerase [Ilumatobacteraceae bacterium]|jgi:diaminopimelate epimerase|nr:diaminopimelate epimerase [Ilumatobacteraceae bacterium]
MHRRLTKHHGLGNDFLVAEIESGESASATAWVDRARTWCDRRTGVGADGLLLLERKSPTRLGMTLYNADGSRAEMSGNGIRCLVQAAHHDGPDGVEYRVDTDAGERLVTVVRRLDESTHLLSVDMGSASDLIEPLDWAALQCHPDRPVRHTSLGNPHSVVGVDDVRAVDLLALGSLVPHVNLEIIEPGPEPHAITMRVHERGAGITMACGTGACAAAEAAVAWGLVPASTPEVLVHMDGGDARVVVERESRRITLIAEATFVASVTVAT